MEYMITPYDLKIFLTIKSTRTNSVLIHFIKRIILLLFFVTDIKCGMSVSKSSHTLSKDNYRKSEFCETLSALPCFQLYQCADAQKKFSLTITLISNALHQHMPIENIRNFKAKKCVQNGKVCFRVNRKILK